MLKLDNVSKTYEKGTVKAVDSLSLELRPGELFGFLGPNGAGKTTTIKMITGILGADSGKIEVCGHDVSRDPIAAKMNIGYVSDGEIVYDKLTGREYVDFLADVYGVSLSDRKARAESMLERFALTSAFDSPIKSYSHGMKQKIAIIGALIHEPKLWVLDEPMTGLDPQSAFELKERMRDHCRAGNTVFFSTHVLEVAEKLCDRVGIIVKGKLAFVGTTEEIKERSADRSLEEAFLDLAGDTGAATSPEASVPEDKPEPGRVYNGVDFDNSAEPTTSHNSAEPTAFQTPAENLSSAPFGQNPPATSPEAKSGEREEGDGSNACNSNSGVNNADNNGNFGGVGNSNGESVNSGKNDNANKNVNSVNSGKNGETR